MSSKTNLLRKASYEIEVRDPQLERPCPLPAHSLRYPSTGTVPGPPLVNPYPHPVATGALLVPPVTKVPLRSPSGTVWPQGLFVSTSHVVGLPADWVSLPQDVGSGARNGTHLKLAVWMSDSNLQNEVRRTY